MSSKPSKLKVRSRTHEFVKYRKIRRPNKQFGHSDRDRLVVDENGEPKDTKIELPPEWVDDVEEAKEIFTKIEEEMKVLQNMHQQHIFQPNPFDTMKEEQAIEIKTQEITTLFHQCQKCIQTIGRKGENAKKKEDTSSKLKMTRNIMNSLAQRLQDQSAQFRRLQSDYLKKIKARDAGTLQQTSQTDMADTEDFDQDAVDDRFDDEQTRVMKQTAMNIQQREQEILNIVRSITELSEIFKDLATMIIDQGTILDRIDYNIEMAAVHIEKGHQELVQAKQYQKSATKKIIIILLIFVILAFILIIVIAGKHKK